MTDHTFPCFQCSTLFLFLFLFIHSPDVSRASDNPTQEPAAIILDLRGKCAVELSSKEQAGTQARREAGSFV